MPGIHVVNFGGLSGTADGAYVRYFMGSAGWIEGVNLFGAPYDWRLPSAGLAQYYSALQTLIEQASDSAGGARVTLMTPSYGSGVALGFLHRMSRQWKDARIAWFIASAPIWGGTTIASEELVAPQTGALGPASWAAKLERVVAATIPAVYWMAPRPGLPTTGCFGPSEMLVRTPSRNYSAYNLSELYTDVGLRSKLDEYKCLLEDPDLADFAPPFVDTFVAYGGGVATPLTVTYEHDFDGRAPGETPAATSFEPGDG